MNTPISKTTAELIANALGDAVIRQREALIQIRDRPTPRLNAARLEILHLKRIARDALQQ